MKKQFNIGDLVKMRAIGQNMSPQASEAQRRYLRKHMPHMFEIGLVIANDIVKGCVVAFPSRQTPVSTLNLVLA
jgi:hypothetical protein